MIYKETILEVADNSGAKKLNCFHIPGGTRRQRATVGDVIICSVREVEPGSAVKKKEVVKAVIVRTKVARPRPDGITVTFDDNAAVILNDKGEMRGTRIFGAVSRTLRDKNFMKIVSLAPEVI